MTATVRFVVAGIPRGKERPRFDLRRGHVYTPKQTNRYEHMVAAHWLAAVGRWRSGSYLGPIAVVLRVFFPDRLRRDIDNVAKSVTDAMNGGPYVDDSQVHELHVYRAIDKMRPRVEVEVFRLEEP